MSLLLLQQGGVNLSHRVVLEQGVDQRPAGFNLCGVWSEVMGINEREKG